MHAELANRKCQGQKRTILDKRSFGHILKLDVNYLEINSSGKLEEER